MARHAAVSDAFAAAAPVSIVMTDRRFRVIKASGQWLSNFKLTEAEAIGRSIFEIGPQYARYKDAYRRVLKGEEFRSDLVRWKNPSQDRTLWYRSVILPWREKGRIGGIHISAHDVTEMVEAKFLTERSEARLQLAARMAKMHVFELDFERGVLEKSGAEETFYERPQTFDDMRTNSMEVVHPDHRERVREIFRRHVAEGLPYDTEYPINREDREVWAAAQLLATVGSNGELLRVIGALQDITERKQAERALLAAKDEAEAANAAKSAFLATMSHEIRTPLNGVLGMAQAMANDDLSPAQRERLDIIRQSGESLLAILNDVLDLSKIEAGRLELEEIDFDLAEVVRGAHAAFTATANRKGLSFRLHVDQTAEGVYRGDPVRVRQIIYNLLSNALKFTEEGWVDVVVDFEDRALRIKVQDTGIGIPPERLDRLFEKFEQADTSTTRRFGGTGLGLSICRELTRLMGGEIAAESEVGRGTCFTVVLPLARSAKTLERRAEPEPAPAPDVNLDQRRLRILAAEDNAVNQLVLKTLLHQIGVELAIVENGALAVEAWRREPWDLILMDVRMPEMDGPTATRLIRQAEAASNLPRTPIIALTANAMAHQVGEYLAAGMDAYVAKPIQIDRLFATMEEVLANEPEAASPAGRRTA
jgi:PAS domain S-box-containing protein